MFMSSAVTFAWAGGKFLGWFLSKCVKKLYLVMRMGFPAPVRGFQPVSLFLLDFPVNSISLNTRPTLLSPSLIVCDFQFWRLRSMLWEIARSWPLVNANNDREIIGAVFVLTNPGFGIGTITLHLAAKFGEANTSMCNKTYGSFKPDFELARLIEFPQK